MPLTQAQKTKLVADAAAITADKVALAQDDATLAADLAALKIPFSQVLKNKLIADEAKIRADKDKLAAHAATLTADVAALVPDVVAVPPPPPPGASPDGTMVPPSLSITLASGVVLTLGAVYVTDPPNRDLLRNGVAVDRGVLIEWKRGFVWNQYSNHGVLEWWKSLDGTTSVRAAPGETPDNPAPYAEPVKSFPPMLNVAVGVPVSLLQYVSSALPLVFDPVDDADKTLTVAGVLTAKRVVAAGTVTSAYDDGH